MRVTMLATLLHLCHQSGLTQVTHDDQCRLHWSWWPATDHGTMIQTSNNQMTSIIATVINKVISVHQTGYFEVSIFSDKVVMCVYWGGVNQRCRIVTWAVITDVQLSYLIQLRDTTSHQQHTFNGLHTLDFPLLPR